jgi:hypothetical protein
MQQTLAGIEIRLKGASTQPSTTGFFKQYSSTVLPVWHERQDAVIAIQQITESDKV